MKKPIVLIAAILIALAMFAPITARDAAMPPPPIWCPGPGGIMVLCSPLPTPQRYCQPPGSDFVPCTPTPAPRQQPPTIKATPLPPGVRYWFWLIFRK
jgi:hypothetical protein